MNSPATGSSHQTPARVFATRPIRVATARQPHSRFCAPLPLVAAEPSFSPRRRLAIPHHGHISSDPAMMPAATPTLPSMHSHPRLVQASHLARRARRSQAASRGGPAVWTSGSGWRGKSDATTEDRLTVAARPRGVLPWVPTDRATLRSVRRVARRGAQLSSCATSCWTRRPISSRVWRTSSAGRPFGSGSSQSR